MDKERELYDKLVDVLNARLDGEPSAQDLTVVLNFLKHNNIQATRKHEGVDKLANQVANKLPFEDDEVDSELPALPIIKRIK